MPKPIILALSVLGLVQSACDNSRAVAASVPQAVTVSSAPKSPPTAAVIAKLVFITKEHVCDCTRRKVETALSAVSQVLGEPSRIPIEILKADTQGSQVETYRAQHPMVALPAIYFVNENGNVITVLQGEITVEQIRQALGQR